MTQNSTCRGGPWLLVFQLPLVLPDASLCSRAHKRTNRPRRRIHSQWDTPAMDLTVGRFEFQQMSAFSLLFDPFRPWKAWSPFLQKHCLNMPEPPMIWSHLGPCCTQFFDSSLHASGAQNLVVYFVLVDWVRLPITNLLSDPQLITSTTPFPAFWPYSGPTILTYTFSANGIFNWWELGWPWPWSSGIIWPFHAISKTCLLRVAWLWLLAFPTALRSTSLLQFVDLAASSRLPEEAKSSSNWLTCYWSHL